MKKIKNKKPREVVYHQHKDINGMICGKKHDIEAKHKNERTQARHRLTVLELI